jgi:hypothetical protein
MVLLEYDEVYQHEFLSIDRFDSVGGLPYKNLEGPVIKTWEQAEEDRQRAIEQESRIFLNSR